MKILSVLYFTSLMSIESVQVQPTLKNELLK